MHERRGPALFHTSSCYEQTGTEASLMLVGSEHQLQGVDDDACACQVLVAKYT